MTKLLLVSIHKAGTNMITQAIGGNHQQIDGKMEKRYDHPHPEVIKDLKEFNRFGRSHLPYHERYCQIMRDQGGKILFVYRDLRDCIVSWTHYVDKIRGTEWFTNYSIGNGKRLEDLEFTDRMTSIIMRSRWIYERFTNWIDTPDDLVHKMRYEDVLTNREETFKKFIDWMGEDLVRELSREFDCSSPEYMIKRIDPENCNTYRKGTSGQWKAYFTSTQRKYFDRYLGDLLERLGYDKAD